MLDGDAPELFCRREVGRRLGGDTPFATWLAEMPAKGRHVERNSEMKLVSSLGSTVLSQEWPVFLCGKDLIY